MARSTVLACSLAVHGAIALVAIVVLTHAPPAPLTRDAPAVAVEVVQPRALDEPRGGAPQAAPSSPPRIAAPRVANAARIRSTHAIDSAPDASVTAIDAPGGHAGDGRGGAGRGTGIGFGDGGRIDAASAVAQLTVPTPEPLLPSRARPPRLIYPAREREVDDSQLFVARLTIDPDGYVVGAHLVRGARGRADDRAEQAVWRFRYSPALDDDGRPTTATIEQSFAVE